MPAELSIRRLAHVMGITAPELFYMARNISQFYRPPRNVWIKGRPRTVAPPRQDLKQRMKRLHRFLQAEFPPDKVVHGGARGRSCFSAARRHLGRSLLVTRDVEKCFPSISRDSLYVRLQRMEFPRTVARVLSCLFTLNGEVPLGSPVSGDALNILLKASDQRLRTEIAVLGGRPTRTYDDIVVSTNLPENQAQIEAAVESAITYAGLTVNEKKRDHYGTRTRSTRRYVHNLDVSDARGVRIVREQRRSALDGAQSYVRSARCVSAESLEVVACKRRRLCGWLSHLGQADFSPVRHLRKLLRDGDRHVLRRLRTMGLHCRRRKWWHKNSSQRCNEPRILAEMWRKRLPSQAM